MIIFLFVFLAGIANAFMDTISHKGGGILPKGNWWSMELSWRNKWRNGDPKQGEAFFLSSTALVFLTDAWHFFQFLMITFFCLAISLSFKYDFLYLYNYLVTTIIYTIIFKILFSLGFEIFWKILNNGR